jgi:GntR family transcriptional regulator, transcriptional repressor for pyruvate dehydrogenase complex
MTPRTPPGPTRITPPELPLEGFEAIRRSRVYEHVAKQLRSMIVSGKLKPGERLPPERELVRRFEVSRGSVRDAIRTLEVMGLVRSRQGEGTVVQDLSAESMIAPLSAVLAPKGKLVAELLDVRRIVEPAFAARAAMHATSDEIEHLQDILRRQQEKAARGESTIEEDSEFHYTVALASRNSVVNKFVDVLMDLMRESRARSLQVQGRLEHSLSGHTRVLKAIQRRSGRAAENAMRRHLDEIGTLLLNNLQPPKGP